jgi:malate/lactate dehydrogenase
MVARHSTKVAIVGAGNVGATAAYALLLSGLAAEIVLIDANQKRAEGEAMDLAHAVSSRVPRRSGRVTIRTVLAPSSQSEICLSLPSIVGAGGVEEVLELRLSASEEEALRTSAQALREAQAEVLS